MRISGRSSPEKRLDAGAAPGVYLSGRPELRLGREGFDTVENLSHSAAVDLAVRTGLSYGQLEQWKGQSWLCSHLRDDYEAFIKRTAITSRDELKAYREGWKPGASPAEAAAHLANGDKALEIKLEATLILA